MAYVTIADSDIDPESPITSSLMTHLRDNPIAIAAGTSPAPQIQTAAIASSAITADKIGNSAVTNAKIATSAVTYLKLGIGTRSYSGTIPAGNYVDIVVADNYAFDPMFAGMAITSTIERISDGFRITNTAASTQPYAVSWRYVS